MATKRAAHRKRAYHHGDLHKALLTAGLKEAKKTGATNLGVTHIAGLVGVSPMAVYRHFADGDDLKACIAQKAREELGHRMLAAIEGETDPAQRFLALGRAYIYFGLNEPGLFSVAFLGGSKEPIQPDNPAAWAIFQDSILDLCNAGIIEPSEVQDVAGFVWSAVHGYTTLAISSDPMAPKAEPQVIEDVVQRIWTGVSRYRRKS